MTDIMAGMGNLVNLNNQTMNNYNNKINIGSFQNLQGYGNISKLDDFISPLNGEDSELFKGVVTKIQGGQNLQSTDFEGLSKENTQLAKDLQSLLNNNQGRKITSVEGINNSKEIVNKFSKLLGNYMNNVNNTEMKAEKAVETFASGGNIDLHTVMIATEKANLSMQLALQLRNKVLQAYQQIQRIRV